MAEKEEPSIEEILGSIRRIIAEDDDAPAAAAPALADDEGEEDEPLELTDKIEEQPQPVEQVEENVEISFADPTPVQPSVQDVAQDIPQYEESVPMTDYSSTSDVADSILSDTTAAATASVMAQLARHTAVTEEGHEGITIENIVREMLKPMLRDWLDRNLPDMVEKMVARELDRLSRRV